MTNEKILQYLNDGKYDELKKVLLDEVYKKTCSVDKKKRYNAMKRYIRDRSKEREINFRYPCEEVDVNLHFINGRVNCFMTPQYFVFTKEDLGQLETFNYKYPKENYFDESYNRILGNIQDFCTLENIIDLNKVFVIGKSKGYKFTKQNLFIGELDKNVYILNYKNHYYNLALLDESFSIINDGKIAKSFISENKTFPLVIKNDIGVVILFPMYPKESFLFEDKCTVIDYDELENMEGK